MGPQAMQRCHDERSRPHRAARRPPAHGRVRPRARHRSLSRGRGPGYAIRPIAVCLRAAHRHPAPAQLRRPAFRSGASAIRARGVRRLFGLSGARPQRSDRPPTRHRGDRDRPGTPRSGTPRRRGGHAIRQDGPSVPQRREVSAASASGGDGQCPRPPGLRTRRSVALHVLRGSHRVRLPGLAAVRRHTARSSQAPGHAPMAQPESRLVSQPIAARAGGGSRNPDDTACNESGGVSAAAVRGLGGRRAMCVEGASAI